MFVNLSGGPVGGDTVEVDDNLADFAIAITEVPVYSATGEFQGCDPAYAGALIPNPNDMFAEKRTLIWDELKAIRDHLQASGTKVGNYWFHSDISSRIQQIGLVMMGANIPPGLMWKTMSGEVVTMTQTLAMQIFGAQAAHDMALFGIAEAKRKVMNTMQDPTSYDVTTGWPATYEADPL